ncbi:MAG: aminomethyl-transferring glycine dehydrogenase subunit GcvPA [Candidatus Tectomicrobia bacterium]|uniref:Probable glycine dehydrogenase (decarboxylating) subunit 1 n=1 Tax=Tectimicrobiota bacterium TaxID=2528274 RepID=A0A933GLG7_UNCTE|nr:aminomethyl-transferring glycine dehydrogenase subunit GcvPA [Candidatus Tectomicrobia bacterium]
MDEKAFPYISNTADDVGRMLQEIGSSSVEDFLKHIPSAFRLFKPLNLPQATSEPELLREMLACSRKNASAENYDYFLGAGAYHHYVPSVVSHLIGRSEFYTSYTPYQAEISQGNLQAIYEYQSLICALTDMEVANASMYEGASALAEAVLMASRINEKKGVLLPASLHSEYKQVVQTYARSSGLELREFACGNDGTNDFSDFERLISGSCSSVVLQNPNFFGCIENVAPFIDLAHKMGALAIGLILEPVSLGILKPPGTLGADIVVGEAQGFGNFLNYGGPYLGFFATREEFVREMPGRLVGQTQDKQGRRGFCLTLATREQHIRRKKATSNICTNENLCALAATVYLSTLGPKGLSHLAHLNLQRTEYAKGRISQLPGYSLKYSAPTFNEFVVTLPEDVDIISKVLLENGIVGGLELKRFFPKMTRDMMFCVTEMNDKQDIDRLVEVLSRIG